MSLGVNVGDTVSLTAVYERYDSTGVGVGEKHALSRLVIGVCTVWPLLQADLILFVFPLCLERRWPICRIMS